MTKILNTTKKAALLSLVLAIGYVIGSIHAPFEIKWRSGYGDGLPDVTGHDAQRAEVNELIGMALE